MLVRTVTPMTSVGLPPRLAAAAFAASAAARIIRLPPDACTLTIHTPRADAASTAVATVFGMSWIFEVEEDPVASIAQSPDHGGSFGGEQPIADLEAAGDIPQAVCKAERATAILDIECNQELIHAFSFRLVSSVPVMSPRRAMECRSM